MENQNIGNNKSRSLLESTITAAGGLFSAIRSEEKVRQVVLAMIITCTVCFFADVGYFQIVMVIFSWIISLICEIFNTALEKALDYTSGKEYHLLIGQSKDYAAACTFVAICSAAALTLFVLWARFHPSAAGGF